MISTRSVGLLIDTVVCLTLAKWETVSGRFGGYFRMIPRFHRAVCDYFTFGSAPVPAITRAEKPVLSDSKFSPFPFRHCMVSVRDSDLISRPASRKVSHIQAVERNP